MCTRRFRHDAIAQLANHNTVNKMHCAAIRFFSWLLLLLPLSGLLSRPVQADPWIASADQVRACRLFQLAELRRYQANSCSGEGLDLGKPSASVQCYRAV